MLSALILDIDNCISDDQWRLKFIRPDCHMKQGRDLLRCFDDYHSLAGFDECYIAGYKPYLNATETAIFVTSRPEKFRALTEEWIRRHSILASAILMRDNHDYRKASIVKAELLDTYLTKNKDIIARSQVLAFDDHQEIVDAYKKLNIDAVQRCINIRDHNH